MQTSVFLLKCKYEHYLSTRGMCSLYKVKPAASSTKDLDNRFICGLTREDGLVIPRIYSRFPVMWRANMEWPLGRVGMSGYYFRNQWYSASCRIASYNYHYLFQ